MLRGPIVLLALGLMVAAPTASAVTYSYVGNAFDLIQDDPSVAGTYDTSMFVTFSFERADLLAQNLDDVDVTASVLAFSAFDGRNAIDETTVSGLQVRVSTDADRNITGWTVSASVHPSAPQELGDEIHQIFTRNDTSQRDGGSTEVCVIELVPGVCAFAEDSGQVANAPGTWTLVPEPATALLLAPGLLGLAAGRRARGR